VGRACSTNGEQKIASQLLVGKQKINRPLGRPRRRLVDNEKMDLRQMVWVVWTGLAWLRIRTNGRLL
jgi:hypothetical protein